MSNEADSRFTNESGFASTNKTTQERLTSNTVGLVKLSDFRKRRAEVIEQQEREAHEAVTPGSTGGAVPSRSLTGTPDPAAGSDATSQVKKKAKKRKVGGTKLSFADDDGEEGEDGEGADGPDLKPRTDKPKPAGPKGAKFKPNASVAVVPRAVTKAALQREAAEREALRREFLAKQEAVKAAEIIVPFVFYDGSNIPGGIVRIKKGDFVWVFLDKSRKVGADLGVGDKANSRREWARVGVDDLMMVRDNVIIPHHYEFLYFIMNKSLGPSGGLLFDYSTDPPPPRISNSQATASEPPAATTTRAAKPPMDPNTLEGASADPTFTKVVDRRWYERNKHIYPASVWQDFDAEKDYQKEVRKDLGGNTFFFS